MQLYVLQFIKIVMDKDKITDELVQRIDILAPLKSEIGEAAQAIISSYEKGGKLLVCGNGGSSADSGHFVGEMMKGFVLKRSLDNSLKEILRSISPERGNILAENLQQGLPAISLSAHSDLMTAIINDMGGTLVFAQQVTGYGKPGDVLLGISTSGNSQDVVDAMIVAKAKGLFTIGLTGREGGEMRKYSDILINVPEISTHLVQELQLPVYHAICLIVESHFFEIKDNI